MARIKNCSFDPKLNEWLFDYMKNLTIEQKNLLNHYELRLIRDNGALKRFVTNENLERKLSLLTKIGLQWNLMLSPTKKLTAEYVKKAYTQYAMKDKSVEIIEGMLKDRVFVYNSRDLAMAMSIMSNNNHSEVYVINPAFFKFNKDSKSFKYTNLQKNGYGAAKNMNVKHEEVLRGTNNLMRIMFETKRLDDYVFSTFNLKMVDVMILWLVYAMPYSFVTTDFMKRELGSEFKPQMVGLRCTYLFRDRNMIDKRPSVEGKISYMITQEGIITVGTINNYILNRVYGQ